MRTARRRIPTLPLEVARDAIRQGASPSVVAECADQATLPERVGLAVELLRAAAELLKIAGVHYTTIHIRDNGDASSSFQTYTAEEADALNDAAAGLGMHTSIIGDVNAYPGTRKRVTP